MSVINSIKSAISNSDSELLELLLQKLSKAEIQELACSLKAISATINMSGTWVEECKTNLLDASGEVIISDIKVKRGFKGNLSQYYDISNLHSAALVVLDPNFTSDYDEDYFSPGEMLFGQDYGYGATSSDCDADCKSEQKIFSQDEAEGEEFDSLDCEIGDDERELNLSDACVSIDNLIIELDGYPPVSIGIHEDINYLVLWFIFSVLFNSSGKTVQDLGGQSRLISDFMSENFQISV